MRKLVPAVVFTQFVLCTLALSDVPGGTTNITTEAFCDRVKGSYKIEAANGVKPKPEAEFASIEKDLEAKECVFTFPYCIPNAACDPGYVFLGFGTTKVSETKGSAGASSYSILLDTNGKKLRYALELEQKKLRFINYQYIMPNGDSVTLEHRGNKANDNDDEFAVNEE